MDRLRDDPRRDLARLDELLGVVAAYERVRDMVPPGGEVPPALVDARWMLEELRLPLFAPSVRAAPGVSAKRILRRLADVRP